ncbi:MAG TPA: hypothetical protein VN493_02355 [Thermoanaerobaculia bacterium]|nr:hypothetical protein [Thermoanaerobaculia bacterium]
MDYADILRSLASTGARFAVAGGFASLAHGVVRVTMDLDLVVDAQDDNLMLLWDTLTGLGFSPQQPIPRASAISAEALLKIADEKGMRAFSWSHGTQPFLVVDLLVGPPFQWNEDLLERVRIFGVEVLVLRKEELIRLKRLAGRDKDLADVRELEKLP